MLKDIPFYATAHELCIKKTFYSAGLRDIKAEYSQDRPLYVL